MKNNMITAVVAGAISAMLSFNASARDVKHELGTTTVPDQPQRIVVLEFSFVDALAAVGVVPVGIADDKKRERISSAYTDKIGEDWVSVGTRKTPSLEVIASLNPDLIIADKTRHTAAYDTLSEIAPTVVFDSLGGDYPSAIAQLETIGAAVGKPDEMKARVDAHKAKIAEIGAQFKDAGNYKIQFGVANAKGLWLHSPVSYNGSLLKSFGFTSGMAPTEGAVYESNYVKTSLEQLSTVNPDILILGRYANPSFADGWKGEALYEGITAVKNNRVFYVEAHVWSRLRGMVAAETTARDLLNIMKQVQN
ncbi:Fe(3+) dicitrate ABC transporter substrate-binding protein [Pseudovibrio sp. Tun.PSC04-5.I4]|uniref:ABC transporter substrate-binding protein n=1 Tax=Pseudovibrio sp. Tun.PSC04-5.I4 TaxID=1798213 RepID=UPI00088BC4DE|nr:Fe(3+) dicitrate ABC transporter substrate-binding protein [Pseudovibrio sp. Tun.PSC04-5.I4]SDQ86440.1 iron complex transport system substrate-binding protein [Pseudovibrio sp. Tun.PSC04-5.I4]